MPLRRTNLRTVVARSGFLIAMSISSQLCGVMPTALAEAPKTSAQLERTDLFGDALPSGAVARLGTVRFRHGSTIYAACMSADGKLLASTGGHNVTNIWDANTGKKICEITGPRFYANDAVAFSPDGGEVAVGGMDGVYICNSQTGAVKRHVPPAPVFSLAYSRDGKLLAAGTESAGTTVMDAATGDKRHHFQVTPAPQPGPQAAANRTFVWSVAFSPDGKTLAAVENGMVYLWDLATENKVQDISANGEAILAIAFSPDGSKLATGGKNKIIELWDVSTGKMLKRIEGHETTITSLVFSPNGKALLSGSGNNNRRSTGNNERNSLRLWDCDTGTQIGQLDVGSDGVTSLAFSPDGRTLVSAGGGTLRIWDYAAKRERLSFRGHQGWVASLAFSSDGKAIATGGGDYTVRLWDVASGREIRLFEGLKAEVDGLVFTPTGDRIIAGSRDGFVVVWDVESAKELQRFKSANGQYSVALSPDGKTVVAGTFTGTIFQWDLGTGREVRQLAPRKQYDSVQSLSYSPDGKYLAASCFNQADTKKGSEKLNQPVRIWDVETLETPKQLSGHERATMAAVYSPDGKRLATAGWDGTVRLWDSATQNQLWEFRPEKRNSFNSVAFSRDGRVVASVAYGEVIYLCEVASGKERHRINTSQKALTEVAYSPNGKLLASASMDGSVLLWDGQPLRSIKPTVEKLTNDKLESYWTDLGEMDAARAYQSICALTRASSQSVTFLKARLSRVKVEASRVEQLITSLDSEKYAEREQASRELGELGRLAEAAMRQALLRQPSPEGRRRLEQLLNQPGGHNVASKTLRMLRSIEVLEAIESTAAREILKELAAGDEASEVTQEAKAALTRLAKK